MTGRQLNSTMCCAVLECVVLDCGWLYCVCAVRYSAALYTVFAVLSCILSWQTEVDGIIFILSYL